MAENHVFTADEIRAATDRLEQFCALDGVYVVVGNSLQNWDVTGDDILTMLRQFADEKEESANIKARMDAVVKHLEKYKGTKEPDYCCADCIEDIAKEVGFSFAIGEVKKEA